VGHGKDTSYAKVLYSVSLLLDEDEDEGGGGEGGGGGDVF
jgi:hypothetical protein